jgi:hypothetical protein
MSPKSRIRKKRPDRNRRVSRRRGAESEGAGRYTAPVSNIRFRPPWHKGVGGLLVIAGVAIFVICEANTFRIHEYGGHIWYIVGIGVAACSTWWFGLFDPAR